MTLRISARVLILVRHFLNSGIEPCSPCNSVMALFRPKTRGLIGFDL